MLHIEETELPERYRPLLRRLQQAIAEPVVREIMDAEDDLIEEFKDYQRQLADKELQLTKVELEIAKKEEVISQKEEVLSRKEEELQQARQQLQLAIKTLFEAGQTPEHIAGIMNLPLEKVKQLLN
jgi:predicted  nucleic acid-binding Zn-ribbon protein